MRFFCLVFLFLLVGTIVVVLGTSHSDFLLAQNPLVQFLIVVTALFIGVLGIKVFMDFLDEEFFSDEAHEKKLRKDLIQHQRELLKLSQRSITGEMKQSSEALTKASQDIQAETEALLKELRERRQKHG